MQRIIIVDDFDHSSEAQACVITIDGETWDVDLSPEHYHSLMTELKPYMEVGRKRHTSTFTETRALKARIRNWANAQDEYKERTGYPWTAKKSGGYVPHDIVKEYNRIFGTKE